MRFFALVLAASVAAACGKGASTASDAGPDGGAQDCVARATPASSPGAPRRFLTPQAIPLPVRSAFASSPAASRAGSTSVALFAADNGVGAATGASSPFSGAFLLSAQADSPALAVLGVRVFAGFRRGGLLTVGLADDAQGLVQLGAGGGRTLNLPLPAGASAPDQLALAASTQAGELVAAFTATVAGGRTAVFAARLRNASCQACTLAFDAAVAAGPGNNSEELPSVAVGRLGAVAVSFLRPGLPGAASEAWVAQGALGASPLALRPLLVTADAAEEPAPVAFFSDSTLAMVNGRRRAVGLPDAGGLPPEVADVVVRRIEGASVSAEVRVHDDDVTALSTHWLPGAAIDLYDRLWVAFYDTRFQAPGDNAWGPGPNDPARAGACSAVVMLARSDDRGQSFRPNSLVTLDGASVPFDPVPGSTRRARAPLGPVTVTATDTQLLVGYSDVLNGSGVAMLAESPLP